MCSPSDLHVLVSVHFVVEMSHTMIQLTERRNSFGSPYERAAGQTRVHAIRLVRSIARKCTYFVHDKLVLDNNRRVQV